MRNLKLFTLFLCCLLAISCLQTEPESTAFKNPGGDNGKYPYLFATEDSLYMSWISEQKNMATLAVASYSGSNWSSPRTVAKDSSWFVNWADFPAVIADRKGAVALHWLNKKEGGPYAYDVNISFLNDERGRQAPLVPHNDQTATEHGFVSMVPWNQETILAVWLDGRQSAGRTEDEYFDLQYAMSLRGALISTSGVVEQRFLIDDSVCDCCQTSLVKTENGALVAYRDRSENEIRDIYVSRFNGRSWSEGRAVHKDQWKIGACPVNGPILAARDSRVGIAWYTRADDRPVVMAALSVDGGATFEKPVKISDKNPLGRVDAAFHEDKLYVSWVEKVQRNALLSLRSVTPDRRLSKTVATDSVSASRASGFPQLEIFDERLIMAWTELMDGETKVKTVEKKLF